MNLCPSLSFSVSLMLHRSATLLGHEIPSGPFLECRFQLIKFSGIAHEVTEGATAVQASAEDLLQVLL